MRSYRVVISETAEDDLFSIYDYIAERAGREIALRFANDIAEYCNDFSTAPERGTRRDDLRKGLRTVGFRRRATILFSVDYELEKVVIHGIYYAGRSFTQSSDEEDQD